MESHYGAMPVITALTVIGVVAGSLWLKTRDDSAPALRPAPIAAVQPDAGAVPDTEALPAPTRAFIAFTRADSPSELPLNHAYTAEGLRRLAAAIAAAGQSVLWKDRAARLETAAAELEKDPDSLQHSDLARETFIEAADWLDANEARAAAEALDVDEPLRAQKELVDRYFRATAESLEKGQG